MAAKPDTIIDQDMAQQAERHVRSGRYDSVTEVLRAGLDAIDREEDAFSEMLRAKVQEALDDPRPALPADEAFAEIWRRIEAERNS